MILDDDEKARQIGPALQRGSFTVDQDFWQKLALTVSRLVVRVENSGNQSR